MEQNVNVWKANLTNGLILGLAGVVYSLVIYFLDLSLNKVQGYVFMGIEAVILYFLLKSYRDNYKHGQITFGESVGAGVIICLYYSLIMAVFAYLLYSIIDTGLVAKQLAFAEETYAEKRTATGFYRCSHDHPGENNETGFNGTSQYFGQYAVGSGSFIDCQHLHQERGQSSDRNSC